MRADVLVGVCGGWLGCVVAGRDVWWPVGMCGGRLGCMVAAALSLPP